MVIAAWAKALIALCDAPMPAASETLPALESCLAERLLGFDCLDEVWPRGRTAIEWAGIGRQREDALSGIVDLRDRIVTARAETLVDAAVQLRRLAVEAETEALSLRGLLAGPDMRGLVASVKVMQIATGEIEEDIDDDGKDKAVELGRKGGQARAKKLSKKRHAEIARQAAKSRWR